MGEEEDAFAEAEALLQRLQSEEQQREAQAQQEVEVIELNDSNTMEVVSGPGIIEQAVEAQSVEEPVKPKMIPDKDVIASLDKRIEEMVPLLSEIYPNNWHIYRNQDYIKLNPFLRKVIFETGDEDNFVTTHHTIIAIRFPEITITNSKGHSNVIKDLFVFMYMYIKTKPTDKNPCTLVFSSNIKGIRSTLREEEFVSNYIHSHLPRSRGNDYGKPWAPSISTGGFCVGGGTETSSALADLTYRFDILQFELFLYQLSTYVRHESLGGGPYIRMENIRIGRGVSYSSEGVSDCSATVRNYINYLHNTGIQLPLKSSVENSGRKNVLVYDSSNEEHLRILGKITSYPYEKIGINNYVPLTADINVKTEKQLKKLEGLMFNFRGNAVTFKVIPHPVSKVKDPVKYPSYKLIDYTVACINSNIKTFNSLLYAE